MHLWINSIFTIINFLILCIIFYGKFNLSDINWFSNSSVIENAYYVAGIFTIIAVFVSVASLRTSKKMSLDKKNREISTETINVCIEYSNIIIPNMDELSTKFNGKSIKVDILNFNEEKIIQCNKFIEDVDELIFEKAAKVLNKIEGFVLYFEIGDLSIDIAKKIVGKLVCEHIEELSPIIVKTLSEKPDDYKELMSFYSKMKS